jgi:hypothetical protein
LEPRNLSGEERRIFLDALVTYADACTLPHLTPSCPYFVATADGPTCQEQCRGVAERHGASVRPIRSATFDGLVLTGRAIPISSARGIQEFDARQRYVAERQLKLQDQSTASLLLGLGASIRPQLVDARISDHERTLDIWRELERRGIPVERVLRGSIVRDMSMAIAVRVAAPHMLRLNAFPSHIGESLAEQMSRDSESGWSDLLDRVVASFDSPAGAVFAATQELRWGFPFGRVPMSGPDIRLAWLGESAPDDEAIARVAADPHLLIAFSSHFRGRVEEWLSRLLEDDLMATLRADPAPPSVFLALGSTRTTRDEVGLWLWERFTLTELEEWSDSSLLLEWRFTQGESVVDCSSPLMAERRLSSQDVAGLALGRVSKRSGRRQLPRGLDPAYFTGKAAAELAAGRWEEAAEIFTGLVDLRPADGDVWNNLGFCRIPVDPSAALVHLERASLYQLHLPLVNVANRCLTLHLLGRDDDALALAATVATQVVDPAERAWTWIHVDRSTPLQISAESTGPADYLSSLREHIESGCCQR